MLGLGFIATLQSQPHLPPLLAGATEKKCQDVIRVVAAHLGTILVPLTMASTVRPRRNGPARAKEFRRSMEWLKIAGFPRWAIRFYVKIARNTGVLPHEIIRGAACFSASSVMSDPAETRFPKLN